MMGTVWLRLDATQESIIPLINAIFLFVTPWPPSEWLVVLGNIR